MIISLEGCEAAGKTVLLKQLIPFLNYKGKLVHTVHFPSQKTLFGKLAQVILNEHEYKDLDTVNTDFLITLAAIGDQHILKHTTYNYANNLANAYISSRGLVSTLVYSDLHNKTDLTTKILNLLDYLPQPDVIVYLDPPTKVILERLANRTNSSIYDKEELVTVIKTKYDSVLDYLGTRYRILRLSDPNLLGNINHNLETIYQFTYHE